MRNCDPIGLAKAILWEEAKGKLRALAAAEGSNISNAYTQGRLRFQIIEDLVEKFIDEVESEGYHE